MNSKTYVRDIKRAVVLSQAESSAVLRVNLLTVFLIVGTVLSVSCATYAQGSSDPWHASQVMKPGQLVKILSAAGAKKPIILHVGFPFLYRNGHIPGSVAVGSGMKPEGIEALKKYVRDISHNRHVVLYCGCCPWKECPNIRPAFRALEDLGFKNISVLDLQDNFQTDWIQKKFPTEQGNAPSHR